MRCRVLGVKFLMSKRSFFAAVVFFLITLFVTAQENSEITTITIKNARETNYKKNEEFRRWQ